MASGQVIIPKRSVFKSAQQRRAITNAMTARAKDIKVDFDVTTQTWKTKPKTTIEGSGVDERLIKVDSDIYAMLDAGTKAHMIRPRRARVLRFMTPFRAKTVPNQIVSRAGSQGNNEVFSRGVRHPGTKPRNWAKTIAAKWRKEAPIILQRAIDAELR